jgi:hypothetical protein
MPDTVAAPAAADPGGLTMTAVAPPAAAKPDNFHVLLSELNPLQYVPVIGTLYRSTTGDTIPQASREIGGLVMGGLISGPFGVVTGLATLVLEKITGIDPERIGQTLLADIGIGHAPGPAAPDPPQPLPLNTPTPTPTAATKAAAAGDAGAATASAHAAGTAIAQPAAATQAVQSVAWSPSQLSAYGVTRTPTGDLQRGEVSGADVLNDLELARHQTAPAGA